MSKLINPSQTGYGLGFGSTIFRALNISARAVGFGQILVPDMQRGDATTTTATPAQVGSMWNNWRDIPGETAANIRRYGTSPVAIVTDEVAGGVANGGYVNLLLEGFTQAWAAHIVDAAPAIYTAAGSPLGPSYPATNVSRILWGNITNTTAAGVPAFCRRIALLCTGAATTPWAMTSATAAENVAETTAFPFIRPGPVGTLINLHNVANGAQLCEVLFEGLRGF